jgi:hypothetical protein
MYELLMGQRLFEEHVPKSFIYFSENHYGCMWDYIAHVQSMENVLKAICKSDEFSCTDNSIEISQPSPIRENPKYNFWKNFEGPKYTSHFAQGLQYCKYKDHYVPMPEEGEELPSALTVPLPEILSNGDMMSMQCESMLEGLLEVRVDYRLGYGRQYCKFADHKFLEKNGVCISNLMTKSPGQMPFVPNMASMKSSIAAHMLEHEGKQEDAPLIFAHELVMQDVAMLNNFNYIAPEYLYTSSSLDENPELASMFMKPAYKHLSKYEYRTSVDTVSVSFD